MRQTVRKFMTRMAMLVALVILTATNAKAQMDLLGDGTKAFSATSTLDGTYTTTYKNAASTNMSFVQAQTTDLDVVNAAGTKVATATVSLAGYDVTFSVSGSTAAEDGQYTFTVPQGYFYCDFYGMMHYDCSADKFTINLTGANGGGEGGGQDSDFGKPKTVVFDSNNIYEGSVEGLSFNRGTWSTQNGGFIVNASYAAIFEAPVGLVITNIVLTAPTGCTVKLTANPAGTTLNAEATELTWHGSSNRVRFTSNESRNQYIATATVTFSSEEYASKATTYTIVFEPADLPGVGATLDGTEYTAPVESYAEFTEADVVPAVVEGYNSEVTKTVDADGNVTFTVTYTELGPFAVTRDMISPNPDVSISLESDPQFPTYVPGLDAIRIVAPEGVSFVPDYDGVEKSVNVNDRNLKVKVFSYGDQAVVSFSQGSGTITKKGKCTVKVPANIFSTTDGRTNTAFTVTFYIGVPTPAEGDLNEDGVIDGADVEALAEMVLTGVDGQTVGKVAKLIRTVLNK